MKNIGYGCGCGKLTNQLGYKVLFKEEIMTKGEDKDDYWNGVGVFVINQQ